jgi:hypothetical protein
MEDTDGSKRIVMPGAINIAPAYFLDSEKAEDPKTADVEMNILPGGKEVEERDFRRKQVKPF